MMTLKPIASQSPFYYVQRAVRATKAEITYP